MADDDADRAARIGAEGQTADGAPGALRCAGLILLGGRSTRMGHDKYTLRFPGGTLLQRALTALVPVAAPILISVAYGQEAPAGLLDGVTGGIAAHIQVVHDPEPDPGPLWALAAAFRQLDSRPTEGQPAQGHPGSLLVMPVDLPFIESGWLRKLRDGLHGYRCCLVRYEGYENALLAAYDLGLRDKLERLIAAGQRRPMALRWDEPTQVLEAEGGGPGHPLADVDTPQAYAAALLHAGLGTAGAPWVIVEPVVPPRWREGNSNDGGFVALHAGTAGSALDGVCALYPELAAAAQAGVLTLTRLDDAGQARTLQGGDALRTGDRLSVLDTSGG